MSDDSYHFSSGLVLGLLIGGFIVGLLASFIIRPA